MTRTPRHAGGLVALALTLGCLGSALAQGAGAKDAGKARPIIAVLYFDADASYTDLVAFRKGLAELVITDLVQAERWRVVERARMEEVLAELKLQESKSFDQATARQVGKMLLARYQVMGSLLKTKQGVMIQAKLIDVEKNEAIKSVRVVASDDDIFEAEQRLVTQLQARIAEAEAEQPPAEAPKKTGKLRYDTAVKYAQALDAKDRKDKKTAVTKLTEVVKENPDFILAKLDLATLTQ